MALHFVDILLNKHTHTYILSNDINMYREFILKIFLSSIIITNVKNNKYICRYIKIF